MQVHFDTAFFFCWRVFACHALEFPLSLRIICTAAYVVTKGLVSDV